MLNVLIQEQLGPSYGDNLAKAREPIFIGDRVIFTANDPNLKLVNGDIGTISGTCLSDTGKEAMVTVCFDNGNRKLKGDPLDRLEPAYALTIHKAQGSEFEVVIMPIIGLTVSCCREICFTQGSPVGGEK